MFNNNLKYINGRSRHDPGGGLLRPLPLVPAGRERQARDITTTTTNNNNNNNNDNNNNNNNDNDNDNDNDDNIDTYRY